MNKDELDRQIWELRVSLLRIAGGILRHSQNAEDAVSAAIVIAYQKLDTLRSEQSVKPWLYKITVRCCYDIEKKARRERPTADALMPEQPLFASSTLDTLYELLDELPKHMARVLLMYYYEGFSTKEIADMLQMSRPAVSMRLARGRKRLKEMLLLQETEENGDENREE